MPVAPSHFLKRRINEQCTINIVGIRVKISKKNDTLTKKRFLKLALRPDSSLEMVNFKEVFI